MTGTFINIAAVAAGGLGGLLLRRRLPARLAETIFQGVGLFTLVLGTRLALGSENALVVLFSLVLGGMAGEALDLEARLDALGRRLEARYGRKDGDFTKAFVSASLLFCVGPMTILGSIADGLQGDYTILLTKSVMDGLSSVAFASTLGVGVLFSVFTILFYQGGLTLLAGSVRQFMTDPVVRELTATGGLMIVGIGINMLGMARIRVANFLPGLLVAIVLARLFLGG